MGALLVLSAGSRMFSVIVRFRERGSICVAIACSSRSHHPGRKALQGVSLGLGFLVGSRSALGRPVSGARGDNHGQAFLPKKKTKKKKKKKSSVLNPPLKKKKKKKKKK